jgi:DNA-binding MarR family transcriptional regulator
MNAGEHLYDVLRRIRPVHELSARAVSAALADSDISMPVRAVLERLYDVGPQTVPAIARWLWVTRQGVQSLVDEAKRLGYAESRPNPEHRRSHLIVLTERGRTAYEQLHADELSTLERIAADLDQEDVRACVRVLDHLVRRLGETVQNPPQEGQA